MASQKGVAAQYVEAEKALRRSEERYRLLIEKFADPIVVFNGRYYIECNEAAVKLLGLSSKEEVLKSDFLELLPLRQPNGELSKERADVVVEKTLREGSCRAEWFIRNYAGREFWIEASLSKISFPDEQIVIFTVWRDITDKRKSEEAIRFTQFAVDHAATGIIWVGSDSHILYVNDETCRTLGYSKEELLNMTVQDINLDYPIEKWERVWLAVKKLGSVTVETVYRRKDGLNLPIELTANFMEYEGRGYLCAIVHDIRKRKRTEEELMEREEELRKKSSRLEEANTALKVLLKHRDEDRKDLENKFLSNVKELVLPYLDNLRKTRLDGHQQSCLDIIETNLSDIVSPFLQKMSLKVSNFTPTEIQVANMIKAGKTSKEIAEFMKVSTGTVDTHRNNIRSKLGLNKKKVNLRTYLLSLV